MDEYFWSENGVEIKASLGEKPFQRVLKIIEEENKDEFRVASNNFEVEFWYYDDKILITHFRSYEKGYGTKVIKRFEKVFRKKFDELSIRIGTEEGEERTKNFLEKNDFDIETKEKTNEEWSDAIIGTKRI